MFSGIVEEVATVCSREQRGESVFLEISSSLDHGGTKIGDSICVNGVCLTVVSKRGAELRFEVGVETQRRTDLGALQPGSKVNLERSLALNDRLHGHFVSGHIDAVATLHAIESEGENLKVTWRIPTDLTGYIAPKGSVTLSGVSLTVGEKIGELFSVHLVQHTISNTTLSSLKIGDSANLEVDLLARYVGELIRHA